MWTIHRNGRLYDTLDPKSHAVLQIARSLSSDNPGDSFTVKNETGETVGEFKTTVSHMALTKSVQAAALKKYHETMTPENRVVRDDTITPFFIGLSIRGFSTETRNGCDILSDCPTCRKSSRALVRNDATGKMFQACPYCNTLTTH